MKAMQGSLGLIWAETTSRGRGSLVLHKVGDQKWVNSCCCVPKVGATQVAPKPRPYRVPKGGADLDGPWLWDYAGQGRVGPVHIQHSNVLPTRAGGSGVGANEASGGRG